MNVEIGNEAPQFHSGNVYVLNFWYSACAVLLNGMATTIFWILSSNGMRAGVTFDQLDEAFSAANEGLVRINYKCLVPIYVFSEMKLLFPQQNYNILSSSSYIHISVKDLYISRSGLPILLEEICRPILGLYKLHTDTWMWKLGLRPRYSQKRNT
jgi:hypothetical protein